MGKKEVESRVWRHLITLHVALADVLIRIASSSPHVQVLRRCHCRSLELQPVSVSSLLSCASLSMVMSGVSFVLLL
eukprot:50189-Eustigmatos_ZCMA.PRE.1